jgi:hypothetical protein
MVIAFRIARWFALLAICHSAFSQASPVDPSWMMVSQPKHWISSPRSLHLGSKTGVGEIIVLYPSGQFRYLACNLIQQWDGKVSISRGDGLVVKAGTWSRAGDDVTATAQTVYRVVMSQQPIPDAPKTETYAKVPNGALKRTKDNAVFRPLPRFDDLGFLADLVSCDRRYWDGQKDIDGPQPCMSQAPK